MVRVLFIESKQKNLDINLSKTEIDKLPKKLFLAYSLQYKDLAGKIKKQLLKNKIKIEGFRQILGCSKINTKLPVFLISSGMFHATNLFLQAPAIYILEGSKIDKVSNKEIEKIRIKKKVALMKFLNAETIGILVSTKPGQENLDKAIALKKKLEKKKQVYIFLSNNININQFENFNNIDCWINTACPGLSFDDPNIINIDEVPR